jgi:NAD(P)-dependent dehydrogenase (short-subunit alcohol dehydrogenase family)
MMISQTTLAGRKSKPHLDGVDTRRRAQRAPYQRMKSTCSRIDGGEAPMFTLQGKAAFITGGAAGIGAEIARDFVGAGARVVLGDVDPDGPAAADELGAAGFVHVDVTDEQQVVAALDASVDMVGRLDVLVNNAGIGPDLPPLAESSGDAERKVLEVNLRGVMYGLMHGPARMNDGGSIINTASVAGDGMTVVGMSSYAASKAGVVYLTRTAAIELGPRGIRVNAVSPAGIGGTGMSNLEILIRTLTALGRMGTLEDVIPAYRYLAADESSFVTGTTIKVDGGMTAGVPLNVLDLIPFNEG